jgi:hypothetical protein
MMGFIRQCVKRGRGEGITCVAPLWQVTLVVVGIGSCLGCCPHPTDEESLERFHAQRSRFEELAAMLRAEPDTAPRITRYSSYSILEERVEDYRRRLEALGLVEIGRGGYEIVLKASACGFPSPSSKGYSFNENWERPSSSLVENLDSIYTSGYAYRHIEGGWYLYYLKGGGS